MAETTTQVEDTFEDLANALVTDDEAEGVDSTPETPAPDDGGEPVEGVDRGDGRDAKGRFASSEPQQADDAPAGGEPTKPDAATTPEQQQPPATEPSAPAVAATANPYTVKVGGQEYAVEGATIDDKGGAYIPPNAMPHVTRVLQEGIYKMSHWESELTEARQKAKDEGVAEGRGVAEKIMASIGGFADLLADGFVPIRLTDGTQVLAVDPKAQPVLEFFTTYKRELPRLMAEHERDALKARLEAQIRSEQRETEAQSAEHLTTLKARELAAQVEEWKQHPTLKVLTADDWSELDEIVGATRDAFFVQQNGEWFLDTDKLGTLYEKRAALRTKLAAEAKAAQEASKFNARQNGAPPAKAPAGRRPAAEPAKQEKRDGRDVFEDAFRNWDTLDDDDD